MRTIAIANQKGGVGKTTTASALAAGIAAMGKRVLAVDLDPQGNLTAACGTECGDAPTIYEVLKRACAPGDAVREAKGGYGIIPSNIMLAAAEQELSQTGKEYRLREALEELGGRYDYAILDTPPSLGLLTVNAATAADEIIIPTTASVFAASGVSQLSDTVANVKKYGNPALEIAGILFTRFNPRTNISRQMRELTSEIGEYINAPVYKTYIRAAVAVEEAQANGTDIYRHGGGRSTVSEDYKAFVVEFIESEEGHGKRGF